MTRIFSEEIEEIDFAEGQVLDSKGPRVGTGWGMGWKWFPPRWIFLMGLQCAYGHM